jgi:hypothetical protein
MLYNIFRTSLINISLLYHRQARKVRSYHTQSFVLCDADELTSTGVIGRRESILICKRGGFTYWSGSLRAGSYVLIPFSTSFWRTNVDNRDFTIVIHSSVQLDLSVRNKPQTFLANCLISAAIKNCKQEQVCLIISFLNIVLTMMFFLDEGRHFL